MIDSTIQIEFLNVRQVIHGNRSKKRLLLAIILMSLLSLLSIMTGILQENAITLARIEMSSPATQEVNDYLSDSL